MPVALPDAETMGSGMPLDDEEPVALNGGVPVELNEPDVVGVCEGVDARLTGSVCDAVSETGMAVTLGVADGVGDAVVQKARPPTGTRLPSLQRHVNTGTPAPAEGPNDSQSDGVKYWKGRIDKNSTVT